jgi:hypothetical protein
VLSAVENKLSNFLMYFVCERTNEADFNPQIRDGASGGYGPIVAPTGPGLIAGSVEFSETL